MTLVGREKLDVFMRKHTDTRSWIKNWVSDVAGSNWQNTQDIKNRYPTASFLADNIVFFNVKGNSYRLQIQVAFKTGKVIVKWIGTHAEYTKLYS